MERWHGASVLTSRGIIDNQRERRNLSVRPKCKLITMSKICRSFKIIVAHVFLEFGEFMMMWSFLKKRGKDAPILMLFPGLQSMALMVSIESQYLGHPVSGSREEYPGLLYSLPRCTQRGNILKRSKLLTKIQAYRCRTNTYSNKNYILQQTEQSSLLMIPYFVLYVVYVCVGRKCSPNPHVYQVWNIKEQES